MDGSDSFDIEAMSSHRLHEILPVLSAAFGPGFDRDWLRWKHQAGPWGESPVWVAQDDSGIIGVRIFLPWRFTLDGRVLRAFRPCDTVTVERARGKGVFRSLTLTAMGEIGDRVDLYFNTPNPSSRPGYLKMGFMEWAQVDQHIGITRPQSSHLSEAIAPSIPQSGLMTQMSDEFLQWRYEKCPRLDYRLSGLSQSESPNGIVWRVRMTRGLRLLVVSELWGSKSEKMALIRAAAQRAKTPLVWIRSNDADLVSLSTRRTATVVTRKDVTVSNLDPPNLSVGDLEDML